jgi:tryptophanyl-tRNA synthetase
MVVSKLEPIQKRYGELMADRAELRQILKRGAERIAPIADSTMKLVRERTGLYQ